MIVSLQYSELSFYYIWKVLGCAVTYFLDVGASILLGAATTSNLNKENRKNKEFCEDYFKANTVECL